MRLKSFYATTMKDAMKMVRDALGEDAIIVATREERGGPGEGMGVRVTAAIDNTYGDYADDFHDYDDNYTSDYADDYADEDDFYDDPYDDEAPAFEPDTDTRVATKDRRSRSAWLQYDNENENAAITEEITDALLRHATPEDVMDNILSCATVVGMETSGVALMAAIEHLFAFAPLPDQTAHGAMMMVGAPGTGKTLAVAKTAARGAMNGLSMGVISTDTVRAGGIEQLRAFTSLLQIDLHEARDAAELDEAIDALQDCDQILIDTPGINPFNKEDVRMLARLIGVDGVEPYLILPGGMDADESGEMARVFATIGAKAIIPTRVDIARRLGGLLSAAHQGGLAFADASNTPKVADGLISLSPQIVAKLLMPAAFRDRDSHDRVSDTTMTTPMRKTGRA